MQFNRMWLVALVLIAGSLLAACAPPPAVTAKKVAPAKVEKVEGTKLSRLTLVPDAAKRLNIQTAPVREEVIVRTRKFGGEVLPPTTAGDLSTVLVRVSVSESDIKQVPESASALILPISGAAGTGSVKAQPAKSPAGSTIPALYYEVNSANHGLTPGQRVFVQVPLAGSGTQRKIIPYGAVLYDAHGDTWTYTTPQSLVFVRQAIAIDYIEGDLAILTDGPAAGTLVVTAGATELYGAEVGVGK